MKADLNNLQAILDKLNKLTPISEDRTSVTTLEGFKILIQTKFHHTETWKDLPSIQAILRVTYNDQLITTWGCCGIDDTTILINWFLTKTYECRRSEDIKNDIDRNTGKDLFASL